MRGLGVDDSLSTVLTPHGLCGWTSTPLRSSSVDASTPSDRLPAPKLLHNLTLPDFDRVGAIQSYWGNPANPHTRRVADRL
jgi:hypothetical protein